MRCRSDALSTGRLHWGVTIQFAILCFVQVEMKDYHFNYKFLKSCKDDIRAYCGDGKSKCVVTS